MIKDVVDSTHDARAVLVLPGVRESDASHFYMLQTQINGDHDNGYASEPFVNVGSKFKKIRSGLPLLRVLMATDHLLTASQSCPQAKRDSTRADRKN